MEPRFIGGNITSISIPVAGSAPLRPSWIPRSLGSCTPVLVDVHMDVIRHLNQNRFQRSRRDVEAHVKGEGAPLGETGPRGSGLPGAEGILGDAELRLREALSAYRSTKQEGSAAASRDRLAQELSRFIERITIGAGRAAGPLAKEFGLHDQDSASELCVALKAYYLSPARGSILGKWDPQKGRKITSYVWEKGKGCARDILRQRLVETINVNLDEKGTIRGGANSGRVNVRQLADVLMVQLGAAGYSMEKRDAILAGIGKIVEESLEDYEVGADGKAAQPLPPELTHSSGETAMASRLRMDKALAELRGICNDMPGSSIKLRGGRTVLATESMVGMFLEYLCIVDPASVSLDESMEAFVERKRRGVDVSGIARHESQVEALARGRGFSVTALKTSIEVGIRFITQHERFPALCKLLIRESTRRDRTPEQVEEATRRLAGLLSDARTPGLQIQAIFIEWVRGWVASSRQP